MPSTVRWKSARSSENVTELDDHVEVSYSPPDGAGEQVESFDGAVIATTAKAALAMFPQMDENHRALYETARYRGLVTVALAIPVLLTSAVVEVYVSPHVLDALTHIQPAPG